jgi:HlyD family secretion protein
MRHLKLLAAIAAFFLLPIGAYYIFKKRHAKELQWYSVEYPTKKDLEQYITATGRLKAQDQITIGSLVAGRVIKLHADDNDFVKKDQVLVELDDGVGYSAVKKAKAALIQAEATLKYTENFYKRQTELYKAGQLAKDTFEGYTKDFENAKAQVLLSQGDLEIREQTYNNLFIKAPESGVVISKKVDLGQMVTARLQATELFIIAKDLKKMEAEIDIDEADIGVVKVGQEAIFTVDAFQHRRFKSTVKQINYDFQVIDNVITYAVILDVENPDLSLRPGMTTNVDIKVAIVKKALCVPNKALRIDRNVLKKIAKKENFVVDEIPKTIDTKTKESIWIFENNVKFREVHVKVGANDGRFVQILEGIHQNTKIVIEALDPTRENPVFSMGRLKV